MKRNVKVGILILLALLVVGAGLYGVSIAGVTGSVTSLTVTDPVKLGTNATLRYTLTDSGLVYIRVYNSGGDGVRTLADGFNKSAGTFTQTWDGTNDAGDVVQDGTYKFVVEQRNAAGEVIGSGDITATAAVQPAITDYSATYPVAPDYFNPANAEKATINYTLSSPADVTVTILKGTSTVRTLGPVNQDAGFNSMDWDGMDSQGVLAADASYTYQITAASSLVTSFKSIQKGTVTVEKELPQVTNFRATPTPLKLGVNNLSISYTLSENATVTVKIVDNLGAVKRIVTDAVAKSAGNGTASWDGLDENSNQVPEGIYTVVLNAVDSFNKSSGDKTVSVTVGYVPPINNAAVSQSPFNPNSATTSINYSLPKKAVVTVQILNGSTVVRTVYNKVTQEPGDYAPVWDGKNGSGTIVSDGNYTFKITAASPTVSTFYSTATGTVTVDKGTISITNLAASPNPMKLGVNNLAVSYTLSDTALVTTTVKKGTTLVKTIASEVQKNAGNVIQTWDGTKDAGSLADEGTYTISVTAVSLTNKSTTASVQATAGYLPVVTLTNTPEPFDPGVGPVQLDFTLSNAANVKLIISQGTRTINTIDCGAKPVGANSVQWDGKNNDVPANLVGDGTYTYKIEATSPTVSTFTGSASGSVTVLGSNPTVTAVSISPTIVKIGTNASIKYTVNEPVSVKVQIVNASNQVVRDFTTESKTAAGNYTLAWDTTNDAGNPVDQGSYTLKIAATDPEENTGLAELAFQAGKIPTISNVAANPENVITSDTVTGTTISYNVDVESFVTVKALDSIGKYWKTVVLNKRVTGDDSVFLSVYSGTTVKTGVLGYSVEASSVIGYFKAQKKSGTFQVGGTGTGDVNCTSCHSNFPTAHKMTNCFGCHGNDEPIQNCAACHNGSHSDGANLSNYECTFCHNDKYPGKIKAGHGDIGPLHDTTLGTDCQKCHNQNLSLEHPLHKNDQGVAFDCTTCHSDTASQTVKDAVYAGNKDCSACHGANPGDHEQYHTPTAIQTDCTKCHKDSLTQEHLSNPTTQTGNTWTCDTCHAATAAQNVQDAVYNGNRNCSACHTANHQTLHQTTNLDANCTTCHNNNLVDEHLTNTKTQSKQDPNYPNDPTKTVLKGWTCDTCHASTNALVVGAIATNNLQCAACHRTGHGLSFTENVLADIPLYQNAADPAFPNGYIWSPPQDAFIWAGESWMPSEFLVGGKLVMSSRRTGVVAQDVYNYYFSDLTTKGWLGTSPAPSFADNFFDVTFTKDIHKAKIMFYGGAYHDATPVVSGGYRIEILYK